MPDSVKSLTCGPRMQKCRYYPVKEVNQIEETLKFYQEIYDDNGKLVEIYENIPMIKGIKR